MRIDKKLIRLHFWNMKKSILVLTDNTMKAVKRIKSLYSKIEYAVATDQNQDVQKDDIQLMFNPKAKLQKQIHL